MDGLAYGLIGFFAGVFFATGLLAIVANMLVKTAISVRPKGTTTEEDPADWWKNGSEEQ